MKDLFSKCKIFLGIWSHLLKKSFNEKLYFLCSVLLMKNCKNVEKCHREYNTTHYIVMPLSYRSLKSCSSVALTQLMIKEKVKSIQAKFLQTQITDYI